MFCVGREQYAKVHQVGSHIILEISEPTHQRIAIPEHDPVRLGTLIFNPARRRQAQRCDT